MRAIKFRAWQKQEKKMYHWGSGVISLDHQLNVYSVANRVFRCQDVELMQFTGIKDTQGTDIYEGDIVQNQQPYFKGIVYFKRGSFWVREIFSHVDEGIYDGDREKETQWSIDLAYKIIGNIYETPDLVESKEHPVD